MRNLDPSSIPDNHMALIPITSTDRSQQQFTSKDSDTQTAQVVTSIIERVRQEGDTALFDLTEKFDSVSLEQLFVPVRKLKEAERLLDDKTRHLLEEAISNIKAFHQKQLQSSWSDQHPDGTVLGEKVTPLDRVGIYVPGGKAFYPSTMIMNTIPAQIAGVKSILIASPPGKDRYPHQLVLAICSMLGLSEILAVGGAHAIAAMAYGTSSVKPVCKITGPGNRFVAEAKRQVFGTVGIDSIAGPSEIVILHDDPDIPTEYLVRDLLTQAEHDEDATAVLITLFPETAEAVQKRIEALVPTLPRQEIIKASLVNHGRIMVVDSVEEGISLVNQIAPEHLELMVKDHSVVDKINNAGAIFIGKWSSETIGDYFAGPNHTIPTSGAARFGSPLSVRDFQKHSSIISYSKARFDKDASIIAALADMEGLHAHAEAIRVRQDRD